MDNSTPEMDELLVQYLDGELDSAVKDNLEQQLAADAALQQRFDSLLLTKESIRLYGLKEKVKGLHQEMMQEMNAAPVKKISSPKRTLRYAMSIAASILLVVGGYIAYSFFSLSSDKVFSSNYQPFELSTTRSGDVAETPTEKAYRAGNLPEVVRIHDAGEDRTAKGNFLGGVAALQLNNTGKAITCFNEVINMNKNATTKVLNDEAEYYLALGYIRNKDFDYALDLLQKIKNDPAHIYHEKVTAKLIRQVKMLKWR
jgi:tetratricopeptide (TPR) repeat protein